MECKRLPASIAFDEKIETVLQANQAARDISKEIRQVTVVAGDLFKHVQIANSEGELIEDQRSRVRLAINVVASREGIIQTGFESVGGVCGWELLEQVDFPELGKKAAQLAVNMLDARPAPAGKMPVVISSDAGGTMVHEACGHGLEADLVQKGLSVYRDRLGQMVAAPGVTVIDDATLEGKYGSFVFDDEATVGQRTVLIENGELKQYMYDRLTAARDNQELTGNGRRESYQHKPVPRMSNTFIAPGPDEPDDIIRSTEKGLFVKKMGGGQVNTTNGDFVFDVQEAYIIENGELKYPVRGATLTGNGPAAWPILTGSGRIWALALAYAGKKVKGYRFPMRSRLFALRK
ncbi:TldD/PmbA family protein [Syntrophomonas palmitatica]|uniref:TldD/PmbA family protein n=1 Tax=Syntrophomonas palmitatica TaxID=402877 RepID=UPI000A77DE05